MFGFTYKKLIIVLILFALAMWLVLFDVYIEGLDYESLILHPLAIVVACIFLYQIARLKKGQEIKGALLIAYLPSVFVVIEANIQNSSHWDNIKFDWPIAILITGVTSSIIATSIARKVIMPHMIKKVILIVLTSLPLVASILYFLLLVYGLGQI